MSTRPTNCKQCNEKLPPPVRNGGRPREFCNPRCRSRFYKPLKSKSVKSKRTNCKQCNEKLPEPTRKGGKPREFCNRTCNQAFHRSNKLGAKTKKVKEHWDINNDVHDLVKRTTKLAERLGHTVTSSNFENGMGSVMVRTKDQHALLMSFTAARNLEEDVEGIPVITLD